MNANLSEVGRSRAVLPITTARRGRLKLMLDGEGSDLRLPPQVQLKRVQKVIVRELTARQRQIVTMYYIEGKQQSDIAVELDVCKSTVSRTLQRAIDRLQRYLRY